MSLNLKKHHQDLLFVPLGGSSEIGMNLNLYHYQGKWLMVDFGIGFADSSWLPGVDVVVPNIEFLRSIKHDIVGLVLTHAHEDHLGAAAYYWNELECSVYATPFTAAFLRAKLAGERVRTKGKAEIKEVTPGANLQLGPFTVDLLNLTHSIPEMQALAITTEKGVVLHTGDWKLDPEPMVGPASDMEGITRIGDKGVLAMVCDSTNVFVEGRSGSEGTVREHLTEEIRNCEGRAIVTTFASNVARLETITQAAQATGRRIVLMGRSLWRITQTAQEAGYLKGVEFLPESETGKIPRHQLLVICTGCQGEPFAALPKIARGDHPGLKLVPGDSVIYSARVIPGNEKRISNIQNQLTLLGVNVVVDTNHKIHVSGHPAREELEDMYRAVRPRIAVPVHGEARHINEHAKLALSMQVPHAFKPYNGVVIHLDAENPSVIGEVTSGYVAIDGSAMLDIDHPTLRMRRRLMDAGVICVTLVCDDVYNLLADPSIFAPGSLDHQEDADLLASMREEIELAVESVPNKGITEDKIKMAVRSCIRRIFKEDVGKKPIIQVEVVMLSD